MLALYGFDPGEGVFEDGDQSSDVRASFCVSSLLQTRCFLLAHSTS